MQRLSSVVPKYARLPIILALVLNCSVYWVTRYLTHGAVHYDLSIPADEHIPFVPAFIIIYVLAFFQWAVGYLIICRESRERCYKVMSGEMITKLICCVFFLALPTVMTRPEVAGTDVFSRLTRLIYSLDTPDNLFPSIHCIESWLCFRGTLGAKSIGRGYKAGSLVFTLLVMASTVLVKQHLLVDIISALAVAELGQALAKKFRTGRFLEGLNTRVFGDTL